MNQNPYAAPQSQVEVTTHINGDLLDTPQAREIGAAFNWLSKGWTLFMQAPGAWVLMALIFFACYLMVSFIPMGGLIIQILLPMVLAGLYLGADKLNFGEDIAVGQMFEGFSRNAGQLAMIGLIGFVMQLVLVIALIVPFLLVFGFSMFTSGGDKPDIGAGSIVLLALLGLLAMAGSFLIAMATWFAPMIVAINNLEAVAAVKLSYQGGIRSFGACFVFGLVAMLLMVISIFTLGLGLLVLFPVMCTSSYVAYREIFYGD